MAEKSGIAGGARAVQLTVECVDGTVRCAGTLDRATRHRVVEAVGELLKAGPACVVVDVGELHVADVDGANALAAVQRSVRAAGVKLRWQGLDSGHLRGILPLRFRARRPRPVPEPPSVRPLGGGVHPSMGPPYPGDPPCG
jgi:ABC-type transporter Mla MlaB component